MSYVIRSCEEKDDETGESLYWSNEDGWVYKADATRLSERETVTFNMPTGRVVIEQEVTP